MNYDIRPLQLRILGNLLAVDKACRDHGLRYYIMAGTLLGAVRHGGFIPWDDDLDIGMPRPDYDRLWQNARQWLPSQYEMVCAETDPAYPLPFAKIQDAETTLIERAHLRYLGGVYIDVFPLDAVPAGAAARRWRYARYEFYKRVLYLLCRDPYKHGRGPSSWAPLLCRRLFTLAGVQRSIRRLLTSGDFDNSRYVGDYDDGLRGAMPRERLGSPTPVEFEGRTVMGVEHAREYLAQKYGPDFMTPPDSAHQRQHRFHLLDLDKPYREAEL